MKKRKPIQRELQAKVLEKHRRRRGCPMTDQEAALSVAKRKQILKNTNRRNVKKRIAELRIDSIKLKKRNLDQKSTKEDYSPLDQRVTLKVESRLC